jgi:hypothetical protein
VDSDSNHKGFYIRKFRNGLLTGSFTELRSEAINLDASVGMTVQGNYFNLNAGARVEASGFKGLWCNNDAPNSVGSTSRCGFGWPNPVNHLVIPNQQSIASVNGAGTGEVPMISVTSQDHIGLAPTGLASYAGGTFTVGGDLPTSGNPITLPNNACYSGLNRSGVSSIPLVCLDMNEKTVLSPNGTPLYTNSPTFSFGGTDLTGRTLRTGTQEPNGSVNGHIGDIYLRTSGGPGTTFYVKETGSGTNTGWVGK